MSNSHTTKTLMFPAFFREWDYSSGKQYTVYLRDFAGISVCTPDLITSLNEATRLTLKAAKDMEVTPTPSQPKHGDVMICVTVSRETHKEYETELTPCEQKTEDDIEKKPFVRDPIVGGEILKGTYLRQSFFPTLNKDVIDQAIFKADDIYIDGKKIKPKHTIEIKNHDSRIAGVSEDLDKDASSDPTDLGLSIIDAIKKAVKEAQQELIKGLIGGAPKRFSLTESEADELSYKIKRMPDGDIKVDITDKRAAGASDVNIRKGYDFENIEVTATPKNKKVSCETTDNENNKITLTCVGTNQRFLIDVGRIKDIYVGINRETIIALNDSPCLLVVSESVGRVNELIDNVSRET